MTGHIDPDRAQFDAFKARDRDTELNMLNLVKFNAQARYPSGHALAEKALTGSEAYALYGEHSGPVLAKVGGSILWRGAFEGIVIGPAEESWDAVFIAHYPNAHAFLAMIADPAYQEAVVHRQAAVATSRLIRTAPRIPRDTFG
ncbi:MAG: DUF1330 domain-containing protein [Pseudomonadota bacterium]